jgi:putative inorganic carbon (HCO3(-)) transporter
MPAARLGALGPSFILAAAAAGVGVLAGIDPPLAIAAVLSFALALVMLADLAVGLCIFTILAFAAQLPKYAGPAVSVSKVVGFLLAVSWVAAMATRRKGRSEFASAHPAMTYVLVAYVAWHLISPLWAESSSSALAATMRLALDVVLFLIVYSAIKTPRQAIWLIAAFVAGAVLDAAYGLLFVSAADPAHLAAQRLGSSIDNPNELASILVAALALSLGLAAASRRASLGRLAALCAAAICGGAIFLTGSRGGLIGLGVALVAFLIVGTRWRMRIVIIAIVLALVGFGYFEFVASADLRSHVSTVGSGTGRLDLWTVGWRMVQANPILGVGPGNFDVSSVHYLLQPGAIEQARYFIGTPKVAHNSYLEVLATLGIVGLAFFIMILGSCVRSALRAARKFSGVDPRMELIALSVVVALAGMLATDFFGSREYAKELWLLLALAPTLLAIARSEQQELEHERHPGSLPPGG